jgi:hypothetical protein
LRRISCLGEENPNAFISPSSPARLGGVLMYSMIFGSTPLARIISSVLREVPHFGLW